MDLSPTKDAHYGLTPEGKLLRQRLIEADIKQGKPAPSKAVVKRELIKLAQDDPQFAENIKKKGTGVQIKRIIIPPNTDDRIKRIEVILGCKTAGNSANMLEELTAILDTLLKDGKIDKQKYLYITSRYNK